LVVASANPEDYTSRGRIITPLKDRYAAQIRTHYPATRELELAVVRQEARIPQAPGVEVFVPPFMEEIIGEITLQARRSPDVNQTSGVSVRMSISNYETLVANALRRAVRLGESEAVPRIVDLEALITSTAGKVELEYAGQERSDTDVVRDLLRRSIRVVFEALVPLEGVASVVESFRQGWNVEVSSEMPAADYLEGLGEIQGLREAAAHLAGGESPARLASAIELVLEGLHLCNRLNKTVSSDRTRYGAA
jgi:magnesium chelatase subunit I